MELPPVFHSLHPPPLNPVISPKEHFSRHIQHDLRAPALPNIISPRPPSLTALPLLPQRSAVSLFWAPNPFFGGRLPLWCDLCTHWPGLGSCREEAGPTVGPLSAAAAERTTGWGRKPDFPLPWATTYIDCPLSGEVRNHPKGFLEAHDLSLFISFPFERIFTEIHVPCMYCHWQYRSVSGLE